MKKRSERHHVTDGSVFEDLGFSKGDSQLLEFKADLHGKLLREIRKHRYTPRALESILDEPQPRISELLNGKISKMSVDKLLKYVFKLGNIKPRLEFERIPDAKIA